MYLKEKYKKTVVMLHPAGVVCSWRKAVHNAEENLFIAIAQPQNGIGHRTVSGARLCEWL
jgi:hypothetical protein